MSLQRRVLNVGLMLCAKLPLTFARNPLWFRKVFEAIAPWLSKAPPFSLYLPTEFSGGRALWISVSPGSHPPRSDKVILHIHGGAFIAGSPNTHKAMLARLSRLAGMRVFAPWYRLAPEHPFPAGLENVVAAFEALCQIGYAPSDIVLGGDSAGGNLALSLLAHLCAEGRPPAAVYLFSPMTDMAFSGASFQENRKRDVLLPASRAGDVADWYLAGEAPIDPRVSPLYAQFNAPPPVLFQYSDSEILRDDSRRMAQVLRDAGGEVHEDIWENLPHVWQWFDGHLPEARLGLQRVADFIKRVTQPLIE